MSSVVCQTLFLIILFFKCEHFYETLCIVKPSMLWFNVFLLQVPTAAQGGCFSVMNKRRGEMVENYEIIVGQSILKAYLPVNESFGKIFDTCYICLYVISLKPWAVCSDVSLSIQTLTC